VRRCVTVRLGRRADRARLHRFARDLRQRRARELRETP